MDGRAVAAVTLAGTIGRCGRWFYSGLYLCGPGGLFDPYPACLDNDRSYTAGRITAAPS